MPWNKFTRFTFFFRFLNRNSPSRQIVDCILTVERVFTDSVPRRGFSPLLSLDRTRFLCYPLHVLFGDVWFVGKTFANINGPQESDTSWGPLSIRLSERCFFYWLLTDHRLDFPHVAILYLYLAPRPMKVNGMSFFRF